MRSSIISSFFQATITAIRTKTRLGGYGAVRSEVTFSVQRQFTKSRTMKIGFVSMPYSGHLNPMIALARKLEARGLRT
jgi:hypothetical protein